MLQITDSHVAATPPPQGAPPSLAEFVRTISGRTTTESLEEVLERIAAVGFEPNVVVHTGDVAETADAVSYRITARMLQRIGVPVLAVAGNHDEPGQLAAAFGEARSYRCDGWLIVLIDSRIRGHECGRLGPDTLTWLDERLASTDAHVLIGLHHPPLSVCGDPDCGLLDSHELLEVIDRHSHVRGSHLRPPPSGRRDRAAGGPLPLVSFDLHSAPPPSPAAREQPDGDSGRCQGSEARGERPPRV